MYLGLIIAQNSIQIGSEFPKEEDINELVYEIITSGYSYR